MTSDRQGVARRPRPLAHAADVRGGRLPFEDNTVRRSAFSLVELVVVIAIIGVTAAIAVPRYGKSLSRYRAQLAAERVAEELRVAGEHARSREAAVSVTADTLAESLTVTETSGASAGSVVSTTRLNADPYRADLYLSLRDGVRGSPSFDAAGLPEADVRIVVMSGDMYVVVAMAEADPRVSVWAPRLWGGGSLDLSDPGEPAGTVVVDADGAVVVAP